MAVRASLIIRRIHMTFKIYKSSRTFIDEKKRKKFRNMLNPFFVGPESSIGTKMKRSKKLDN